MKKAKLRKLRALRGDSKNKVVVLSGAHHKIDHSTPQAVMVKLPHFLWEFLLVPKLNIFLIIPSNVCSESQLDSLSLTTPR